MKVNSTNSCSCCLYGSWEKCTFGLVCYYWSRTNL